MKFFGLILLLLSLVTLLYAREQYEYSSDGKQKSYSDESSDSYSGISSSDKAHAGAVALLVIIIIFVVVLIIVMIIYFCVPYNTDNDDTVYKLQKEDQEKQTHTAITVFGSNRKRVATEVEF